MEVQTNADSGDDLLSKQRAAQRLGISLRSLDYRINARTIPFVRIGRLIKFIPSDLDRFVQSHRIGG